MSTAAQSSELLNIEAFPDSERIFGWISDLAALGHRKTGTPEGRKSADYIAGVFREI